METTAQIDGSSQMMKINRIILASLTALLLMFSLPVPAAHVLADRVLETTTTTGAGALTLSGAATGFRAFSAVCASGDTVPYSLWGINASGQTTGEWESGIGTCGATFSRTQVIASSNTNSAVNLSAGTKYIALSGLSNTAFSNDATDPAGVMVAAQASIARHPFIYWSPTNNSTTVPVVQGIAAYTAVGTATARALATTNAATQIRRLGYVSAATAASLSGHFQATAILNAGDGTNRTSGFYYAQQFVPSDAATVAGARMFVGISSNVGTPTNVEANTLTNAIGVCQLSTDTTQLYLCFGGSSAQTAIALGTTNFPGQTLSTSAFEISIYAPWARASTYYVQVRNLANGAVVTNKLSGAATVVPQTGTLLAPRAWRCNNATALAVGIDSGTVAIQMGI
jgi:hypothetical protein